MRYSDHLYDEDEAPTRLKTPVDCRRKGYEIEIKGRAYCGVADECIYKDSKDAYGYRCLLLDKQI